MEFEISYASRHASLFVRIRLTLRDTIFLRTTDYSRRRQISINLARREFAAKIRSKGERNVNSGAREFIFLRHGDFFWNKMCVREIASHKYVRILYLLREIPRQTRRRALYR